jgi:hypothetical protein
VTETRGHFNTRLDVVTEGTSGRETARSLVRRCPNPSRRGRAALSRRSREGKPLEKPLVFWFPVSDAGIRGRTRAGLARFLCVSAQEGARRHLAQEGATDLEPGTLGLDAPPKKRASSTRLDADRRSLPASVHHKNASFGSVA